MILISKSQSNSRRRECHPLQLSDSLTNRATIVLPRALYSFVPHASRLTVCISLSGTMLLRVTVTCDSFFPSFFLSFFSLSHPHRTGKGGCVWRAGSFFLHPIPKYFHVRERVTWSTGYWGINGDASDPMTHRSEENSRMLMEGWH